MMIKEAISLAGLGMLMLSTAYAEDSRWSYRIGATNVAFDASAKVSIDGTRVPGGSADASDNNALTFDFGYIINDNWNARLIVGIPPTTKVTGADRKSVVSGKSVSVRVDLGGRRIIKKTNKKRTMEVLVTQQQTILRRQI